MRVKDKVAIVTGGAQGIGEGIAIRLAEEGANVAIMDLKIEQAQEVADRINKMGVKAIAIQADTSKKTDVEKAIDNIVSHFNKIDILINNAGYYRMAKITDISEEIWDKILDINLKGYFLMIQSVVPYMQKQNCGKILNIASAAIFGGVPNQAHYTSSKGGVVALTRTLALELAPNRINVNAVLPGTVQTLGNKKFLAQFKEILDKQIPLGRVAQPRDIANAALFLVSDEAEYITGQGLVVCGGVTIGMAPVI